MGAAATPQELAAVAEVRLPGPGSSGQRGRAPHPGHVRWCHMQPCLPLLIYRPCHLADVP